MPRRERSRRGRSPQREKADAPGLAARRLAASALLGVLHRRRPLDEILDPVHGLIELAALEERDRALVRMLTATVLRRLGTLRAILNARLERGLPPDAPHVEIALLLGAAQILFLNVPNHAAVHLSVQLANATRNARFAGLVNAVLRKIAADGRAALDMSDPLIDTPEWLRARWCANYGTETTTAIAEAHRREPPLDLTAKADAKSWADKLGARLLPNGTIRVPNSGPITSLPGFEEGAWWVQDVAASLPARLLGNVAGKRVADLCAAPGGKTGQLANAGAQVVAVDRSANRMKRLEQNLARVGLNAESIVADAAQWRAEPFDAILLDAPCSATGTIRRHPDILWQKQEADLAPLAALQTRLLDNAATLLKRGGILVYATCSLEPEEGEQQIEAFLARHADFAREPISAEQIGGFTSLVTADGDMRSLPCHLSDGEHVGGCDGFYTARLRRRSS
jgi:16S rRNA (cytosine967-C5)-methyltransferase